MTIQKTQLEPDKQPLNFEIFNISGTSRTELYLLMHINEEPDDWETYRSAVVKITPRAIEVVYYIYNWIQSMWYSPSGKIYLASVDGEIHTNASGSWEVLSLGKYSFNYITGLPDGSIVCCGSGAGIFSYDDHQWKLLNKGLPDNCDLITIGGLSLDNLYAFGKRGAVFHYDGDKWTRLESPTSKMLVNMLPVSADEFYCCGWSGTFLIKRKSSWEKKDAPDEHNFYSMIHFEKKLLIAAGNGGIFSFDNNEILPLYRNMPASNLTVIDGNLFAVYGNAFYELNNEAWVKYEPDFGSVIK
ncbi:hypothetical protein A4D02_11055 [Niastella koreensis]|uniref:Uncharacterized protein n=2 Tax=Niastella koreensis TaxID=354356 RepID=G8T8C2_NIAKG|nr:hypothetical protein [Niastella koreensis]AEV99092.1 hypothetical protein Niako_2756 [Niastella koreensis GR20-10]OQP44004.1 hypothetical protein A4D02_11055 [Niastella koreensis]